MRSPKLHTSARFPLVRRERDAPLEALLRRHPLSGLVSTLCVGVVLWGAEVLGEDFEIVSAYHKAGRSTNTFKTRTLRMQVCMRVSLDSRGTLSVDGHGQEDSSTGVFGRSSCLLARGMTSFDPDNHNPPQKRKRPTDHASGFAEPTQVPTKSFQGMRSGCQSMAAARPPPTLPHPAKRMQTRPAVYASRHPTPRVLTKCYTSKLLDQANRPFPWIADADLGYGAGSSAVGPGLHMIKLPLGSCGCSPYECTTYAPTHSAATHRAGAWYVFWKKQTVTAANAQRSDKLPTH
ncbi:hypothetical protein SVAN01_08055 [Stagonosporopsis vannaccii]|nr:hypothetical protein SVAN01_08055 [Stagonosporopsis vannaccii]